MANTNPHKRICNDSKMLGKIFEVWNLINLGFRTKKERKTLAREYSLYENK